MNNDRFQKNIEDLKTGYSQVSLSLEERQKLKNNIFSKIEEKKKPVVSPFLQFSFYFKTASALVLLFAVIGAPISFAAEKSLPGDFLYDVKTKINEEIVAIFVPEEKKDDYYQSLLVRRTEEIKALVEKGEVKKNAIDDFEIALENNVTATLTVLENSKNSEQEILNNHQAVVATLVINEEILKSASAKIEEDEEDTKPEKVDLVEEEDEDNNAEDTNATSTSISTTTAEISLSVNSETDNLENEDDVSVINKIESIRSRAQDALEKRVKEYEEEPKKLGL